MRRRSSKNAHAVALGRLGGASGGTRRAAALSPARRREIASQAARARWSVARGDAPPAERNAARTRERILAAALQEFSAHGYAGGRVERIARRAHVNKRMIYHYFGGKTPLFRELVDGFYARLQSISGGLGDSLEEAQRVMAEHAEWMRIAAWDVLQSGASKDVPPARRAMWRAAVDAIRDEQRRGAIRPDLDAAQLQLSIVALVMFPFVMPQLAALITGQQPTSDEFLAARAAALRAMAALLGRAAG